jgi:hypothetical protein
MCHKGGTLSVCWCLCKVHACGEGGEGATKCSWRLVGGGGGEKGLGDFSYRPAPPGDQHSRISLPPPTLPLVWRVQCPESFNSRRERGRILGLLIREEAYLRKTTYYVTMS